MKINAPEKKPRGINYSFLDLRALRWAGHVARMPMSRAPRLLLTGWVSHSRPIGCPQMTWGRALENALKSKDISKEFDEWIAIASLPRTGRSGDS